MILKLDHIALSSIDFKKDIEFFRNLGYENLFLEKNIENITSKSPFLTNFKENHDLAFLNSASNLDIEILNHGNINSQDGFITAIFENIPRKLTEEIISSKRFDNINFKLAKLKKLDFPVYIAETTEKNKFCFNKAFVKTKDIKSSQFFWEFFGFKLLCNRDFTKMVFKSPLSGKEFYIYLEKNDTFCEDYFLNDKGFNCIAFITNSAKMEKKYFEEKGFMATGINDLEVGNNKLKIFFVNGPCGEKVEIIEIIGKVNSI